MLVVEQGLVAKLIVELDKVSREGGALYGSIRVAQFGELGLFPNDTFKLITVVEGNVHFFAREKVVAKFLNR